MRPPPSRAASSPWPAFWTVVAAALLLRLAGLGRQNFWFDELLSLREAGLSWSALLEALRLSDNNKPPLYFLLLHAWVRGGESEFWLRLPSAVCGALSCGAGYLLAGRLLGARAGAIAGAFLVLSPFGLWYGQEARMYALWGLWTVLGMAALARFARDGGKAGLIGFVACAALAEYTFPYGLFFPVLGGLVWLAAERPLAGARGRALLAGTAAAAALFAPWVLRIVHDGVAAVGIAKGTPLPALAYTAYGLGYGFSLGPATSGLQAEGLAWVWHHPALAAVSGAAFAVFLAIVARGAWESRRDRTVLAFGAGGTLVFLLLPALVSLLKPSITFNPRYAYPALFPCALLFAAGATALWRGGGRGRLLVAAYAAFLGWAVGNYFLDPRYGRDDLRGAAELAARARPEAVVVCDGFLGLTVSHYQPGLGPLVPFSVSDPTRFEAEAEALAERLRGFSRFAVIYGRADHGDRERRLLPWLRARYAEESEETRSGVVVCVFAARR